MASVKGTRTEHNLLAAFAGESQARNRYTYFASVARKEGYRQIEALFELTHHLYRHGGATGYAIADAGPAIYLLIRHTEQNAVHTGYTKKNRRFNCFNHFTDPGRIKLGYRRQAYTMQQRRQSTDSSSKRVEHRQHYQQPVLARLKLKCSHDAVGI